MLTPQRLGGGVIVPCHEATFLILPLPPQGLATDPEHRELVASVVNEAERFAVSSEWVNACIQKGERVGLRGYGVGLAPAV